MDEEKEKMKTGKKLVIALIMILLILTAGAYGYGVHYFTDHFLPGSQVNGFNCSYKTADETEKLLAKEVQAYVLTVDTRNNGKESITAKEAGLVYKPDGGAKKLIKKQARYKWFLAFNQKKKYTLATDTAYEDQNKLTEAVKNLKCMQKDNMEKPADACIKDNGETYEIQPEKEGTTLDTKKVQKVIRAAVSAGGNLMGIVGMLVFIPLLSVFYTIFREFVYLRLKKKHIKQVTKTEIEEYTEEEIVNSDISEGK